MTTYEKLDAMVQRWRYSIPVLTTEDERRTVFIALIAAKAAMEGNGHKGELPNVIKARKELEDEDHRHSTQDQG